MEEDGRKGPVRDQPANDNRPPNGQSAGSEADTFRKLEAVVLTIARLIGSRMAREDYEKAMPAANDNAAPARDEVGPEAEDEGRSERRYHHDPRRSLRPLLRRQSELGLD